MVIAIDGPAGVGKSTIAKRLSEKLGIDYINSGNFYRVITLSVLQKGIDPASQEEVIKEAENCNIQLKQGKMFLNGKDVEELLHTDEVDKHVASLSAIIPVRKIVNIKLQDLSKEISLVVEGRDMTTVVFPTADLKVYLDASVETRALRRWKQGVSSLTLEELIESIKSRDKIDINKPFGGLKISKDAIYLDTSDLTIDQVCEKVLNKIDRKET